MKRSRRFRWFFLGLAALLTASASALACPFCSAVSQTFSEEMAASDAAILAVRVGPAPSTALSADPLAQSKTKFKIVHVLKANPATKPGQVIEAIYFGQDPPERVFLLTGIDPPALMWSTPVPLSPRADAYLRKLPGLPAKGDRLVFFQEHFEDEDEMLARDAYDEFAKAPYADVKELRPRMKHDRLIAWLQDQTLPASRRRLYLTMLGICGTAADLPMLEQMIRSDQREIKTALDAMIACYLTLKGPEGMTLIEDLFLKNKKAEYTDTYAAIMALRFHGQEEQVIPKERLVAGLRHMLDRPELADLVIPDLARWQDWSAMDRLVALFKEADQNSSWVRVPVINYLRACPLPEAKVRIEELAKIDPDAVKRASSFFPFPVAQPKPVKSGEAAGGQGPAAGGSSGADDQNGGAQPAAPAASKGGDSPPKAAAAPTKDKSADASSARDAQSTSMLPAIRPAAAAVAAKPALVLSSPWMVVGVPFVGALVMFFLLLFILRGSRKQVPV
jgi:hypothetical protein